MRQSKKVQDGLKLIKPFQTAISLEDEMTVLELIEQHDDFEPHIAEDARAKTVDFAMPPRLSRRNGKAL